MSHPLTDATRSRLERLFPAATLAEARAALEAYGADVVEHPALLERVRHACLRLSEGSLEGLDRALALARTDWRDALVAAGFAEDVDAHRSWWPEASADAARPFEVRLANATDASAVERLHLAAFDDSEAQQVARLAVELLRLVTEPPTLSLVAERADHLLAHVAFSPATISGDPRRVFVLSPLAVHPGHQARGVGRVLVEDGLARLAADGPTVVLVYGDPAYYGRFGFRVEAASPYFAPYELTYPHGWQALHLAGAEPPVEAARLTVVGPLRRPELW